MTKFIIIGSLKIPNEHRESKLVENKESFSSSHSSNVSSGCSITSTFKGKDIVIAVKGEIDLDSSVDVYRRIWTEIDNGEHGLVLDLEELDFMDSSGLQILLRLKEKLSNVDKKILISNPSNQIMKLFQLTGFDKLFNIYNSNDEALLRLNDKT